MKSCSIRFLLLLLLAGLCLSCKKEQESVSPELSFKTLKDGAILWNSVDIELGIAHPESLSKVEILVNAKLVSTATKAPFTTTWNTQLMSDGPYELMAVATDKQGTTKTAKVNIVVSNALLTFQVPADHLTLPNGFVDKGWVFVSSLSGELLALAEMKNGEKFTLLNSNFNDKSFILSEAYLRNESSSLEISSFMNVPRGPWTLSVEAQDQAIVGSLSVHFIDSVGVHPYYVSTSGDSRIFYEGGNSIQLKLTQSPARLFIREIGKDQNHFNLVEGLTINKSYSELFAELNKPLESVFTPTLTAAKRMGIRLFGFPKPGSFDEFYQLGTFSLNQNQAKIEFPGSSFPVYGSENIYSDNFIRINAFHPTKKFDIAPLSAQVIFKDIGNSRLTLATFGNFDIYLVGWGYAGQTIDFSWVMTGSSGQSELLTLPALPPKLRNSGVAAFDVNKLQFFNVVQVADYEIATDYKSYIQYLSSHGYNAPYVFGKAWKEQTFSYNGYTGGGRANVSELPTIKERFGRKQ